MWILLYEIFCPTFSPGWVWQGTERAYFSNWTCSGLLGDSYGSKGQQVILPSQGGWHSVIKIVKTTQGNTVKIMLGHIMFVSVLMHKIKYFYAALLYCVFIQHLAISFSDKWVLFYLNNIKLIVSIVVYVCNVTLY